MVLALAPMKPSVLSVVTAASTSARRVSTDLSCGVTLLGLPALAIAARHRPSSLLPQACPALPAAARAAKTPPPGCRRQDAGARLTCGRSILRWRSPLIKHIV